MHQDTREELERLEQELLAQEEEMPEEDYGEFLPEPEKEEPMVYRNFSNHYGADLRNFANGYRAYNTDKLDTNLEDFSRQVEAEETSRSLWLPMAAAALAFVGVLYIAWCFLGGLL